MKHVLGPLFKKMEAAGYAAKLHFNETIIHNADATLEELAIGHLGAHVKWRLKVVLTPLKSQKD